MLQPLTDLPAGIDGLEAVGRVSKEDYEHVMEPLLDAARRDGRKVRFLYQIGSEFQAFTPGAAWSDARLGLSNLRLFEAVAIVTDIGWIRESTRLAAFMMPCPVEVFSAADRSRAVEWLRTLSERATVAERIVPETGVLVVDVSQPLRSQDLDAIALTADTWIEAHGKLNGLVIHARRFPGWENLGALMKHVRFVRDHHRKIGRIALAADSPVANIAPSIAEHFVKAEMKAFRYDDVDRAIEWAGRKG
jgi:SpoIIAA-like